MFSPLQRRDKRKQPAKAGVDTAPALSWHVGDGAMEIPKGGIARLAYRRSTRENTIRLVEKMGKH